MIQTTSTIVAGLVVYESPQLTRAGRRERPQSTGTPVEKAPIGRAVAVAARRVAVVSARRHQFANCHRTHRAVAA